MSQHRRIALIGAGFAAVAITVLSTITAADAKRVTTDRVPAAAGWLATQFVGRSHLPSPAGNHFDQKFGDSYFPSYGESADVIFGLAAAKSGQHKINTALHYLVEHVNGYADLRGAAGGPYDGSVGKLAVAALVAGRNPADLGGHNLIATLARDECPNAAALCAAPGSAANIFSSISESFVLLAELRARGSGPTPAAVSYFLSLQCANGGFTSGTAACGSGPADIDATSYAIMTLTALGGHPAKLHHAVRWLRDHQRARGYWVSQGVPNTDSTGLAAAALQGAGRPLSGARRWLRSQQIPAGERGAGGFRYAGTFTPTTRSATSPSVIATAQAITGLVDGGSLATLTANGATWHTRMYAPVIKAPLRAEVGSRVRIHAIGFAAGETVRCVIGRRSHPVIVFPGTVADPAGVVTLHTRVGRALLGTHRIRCAGSFTDLRAHRPITVVAAS